MTKTSGVLRMFYSWQSAADLPKKTNRDAIRENAVDPDFWCASEDGEGMVIRDEPAAT